MFSDEFEDDGEAQHHVENSIEGLRVYVLGMFGLFVSKISDNPSAVDDITEQKKFLTVQEVENIIADMCDVKEDGLYAIGADSFEEYKEKMLALFRALSTRIMSNVMQEGVRRGLVDAEYDFENDRFDFELTEKGKQLAVFGYDADVDSEA
jgi:hypothetical protein